MHSHHSHSGDYVAHAVDSLDSIVQLAHSRGFTIFCLTEHMPRLDSKFIYPEEYDLKYTVTDLSDTFVRYLAHAAKLQLHYRKTTLKILVGYEVEGINEAHIEYSKQVMETNKNIVNMTVGSVHHVHEIPIDFDVESWLQARNATTEKTTRALYRDYFSLQGKVIARLQPTVVGHFDLIRLFSPQNEIDPSTGKKLEDVDIQIDWPEVWNLIVENIKRVKSYGGLFELNSSAIRKGWNTPYPKKDIAEAIIQYGGARFCLSDDSHGLKQVGLNYHKVWQYITDTLKLDTIYSLDLDEKNNTIVVAHSVEILSDSQFWNHYKEI
ncbi:histidinolphosphatase [Scheffersomyces stipitis CBS 6054]|uniref:Histidinol-phosphatase n=1 Tax=Scheffersomyces stipitis (strain ATCC 58785 / CBS 6054 / NBRC 10063 / NRRL Y-11545) TaxID=322104 RepID=A3LY67_PICST|nr:histidinolphosphatase [Scheffersomyces stipitis CBS 6054]ABN67582.2 histidinolphosphatase [Scheffersomyces stipitis CBS 6054]KAG2732295.1 hypothetical protein G9P44_004712 [Scheffersomyces stipitis]